MAATKQAETTGHNSSADLTAKGYPQASGIAPGPIRRTRTDVPELAAGHRWVERITHIDQWTCTRCCAFAKLVTNWFTTHDRKDWYRRTYWLYAETRDAGQYARPVWTVRAGVCR